MCRPMAHEKIPDYYWGKTELWYMATLNLLSGHIQES